MTRVLQAMTHLHYSAAHSFVYAFNIFACLFLKINASNTLVMTNVSAIIGSLSTGQIVQLLIYK